MSAFYGESSGFLHQEHFYVYSKIKHAGMLKNHTVVMNNMIMVPLQAATSLSITSTSAGLERFKHESGIQRASELFYNSIITGDTDGCSFTLFFLIRTIIVLINSIIIECSVNKMPRGCSKFSTQH
jgi:hypothetical protein